MPYFLNLLKKILKINTKIKFNKKKLVGHYITTPYTYVPKKGSKIKIASEIDFNKGIKNLINQIKNNKKL